MTIEKNDLILIVYKDKRYLKRLEPDKGFHGVGGILSFSSLVGKPFGTRFGEYLVYRPTFEDIIMYGVRRETQIVFPKDSAYICFRLDVKPGCRVIEVGAGSGALTLLLSRYAGREGKVVSLEREERHFKNAQKNLQKFGEFDNVELLNQDVDTYEGEDFDAAFIDVREPWLHLERVRSFLRKGAMLGSIVPTTNQVSDTLRVLQQGFGDREVMEILVRRYKPVVERLRPEDRMIAHTGYLVFGRKVDDPEEERAEEQGSGGAGEDGNRGSRNADRGTEEPDAVEDVTPVGSEEQ